ncbi:MAG: AMP-binding protein [Candidatus Bathyarchaeota archaeon]|nr:AMP-binding protein [Candidatus Bathyarchaeota archaeon]
MVKLRTILLTGANGFIATQIAKNLIQKEDTEIVALVRARSMQDAKAKLMREWWDYPELVNSLGTRIHAVNGDVSKLHLGLTPKEYTNVAQKTTHIIHTVADWRILPLDVLRITNVQGTANVIAFAREAKKHHLERLSHVSTAYVAGGATGTITEDQLTDEFGFYSTYEHTKYEGEKLIQNAKAELPISVFRPSMVVGDSETGVIKTFNTLYFPMKLYLMGKLHVLPVSKNLKLNIVPVDYVAKAVVQLTFEAKAQGKTFHLTVPNERLPRLGELMEFAQKWAQTNLYWKLPRAVCIPMSTSAMKALLKIQRAFTGNQRTVDTLLSLAPYFRENRVFNRDNTDRLIGQYDFNWRKVMPRLLEFAVYNSFFHRSDRTVHEQVLYRLESKSHPITYYDLTEGKTVKKTAQEMRNEILAATSALKAMDIGVGDHVALTGLNSTKYFAVDIAIGLAGAISVPLYYTAPPADINEVLKASGAKLFFVGMPSLLARVKELESDIPIVSICRNPIPANMQRPVVSWEDFLTKGKGAEKVAVRAPIGFGDIATLRYSSGTTGKPKGAVYRHDNLRYMAESLVSITSWKARIRKNVYMSFLPMGHVVEGILATYSPYYAPASTDIYFLEDFRRLQQELPHVRPTIFFAVPRIYEKIWEALEKNRLGRFYLNTKNSLLKNLLRRTLRNMLLSRAGLNKCEQLIVGSASSSDSLLRDYREIGIEIHDAYGLTEAPLVTMNRYGKNRLGTVGEPMPFTQVRIAKDGEIMVKGPQVTVGYFDRSIGSPLNDGWLMTGDIGKLTKEGSLIIFGRKKEVIKTSYGKCIYSDKIEGMIRGLPDVNEALLVGESKPFCTAIVWVEKKHYNPAVLAAIDNAVEEMNKGLSHPEKVKRWAILPNNLGIESGELTPNLKPKRAIIAQKNAQIIKALYSNEPVEGEVHVGGVEKAD